MYEYVSLFTLALSTVLGEYIASRYLFNIKTILPDIFNIFFYQLLCHRASCCISRVAYSLDRWIFIICSTSQHITCDNKITRSDTEWLFCISRKYCHKRYCVCELINTDIKKIPRSTTSNLLVKQQTVLRKQYSLPPRRVISNDSLLLIPPSLRNITQNKQSS